jgi:hypothetical protein
VAALRKFRTYPWVEVRTYWKRRPDSETVSEAGDFTNACGSTLVDYGGTCVGGLALMAPKPYSSGKNAEKSAAPGGFSVM